MRNAGYQKLKAFFVENNIKQLDVAEFLHLTRTTFNKKINRNKLDFTMNEVRKMCMKYKLNANEFFLL